MDRREAIRKTTFLLGFAVSGSAATAVLNGCTARNVPDWEPQFFSPEEAECITRIADIILPETETPGAVTVGAPGFVDQLAYACMDSEEQMVLKAGVEQLHAKSTQQYGTSFLLINSEQQVEIVNQEVQDALAFIEPRRRSAEEGDKKPFMARMLEMVILGYFCSETVGEEVLAYLPIPGEFQACIPMEEGQRSWSL